MLYPAELRALVAAIWWWQVLLHDADWWCGRAANWCVLADFRSQHLVRDRVCVGGDSRMISRLAEPGGEWILSLGIAGAGNW